MNPILRHIILQRIRAFYTARKEGTVKKFDILITLEKFIRGGAAGLVGTIIAYQTGKDPAVVIPVIVGLCEAIYNVIKFFIKENKEVAK